MCTWGQGSRQGGPCEVWCGSWMGLAGFYSGSGLMRKQLRFGDGDRGGEQTPLHQGQDI